MCHGACHAGHYKQWKENGSGPGQNIWCTLQRGGKLDQAENTALVSRIRDCLLRGSGYSHTHFSVNEQKAVRNVDSICRWGAKLEQNWWILSSCQWGGTGEWWSILVRPVRQGRCLRKNRIFLVELEWCEMKTLKSGWQQHFCSAFLLQSVNTAG